MDYEIDIEEHDVLDNPVIKSIFPDLTILKQEILGDHYEQPIVEQNVKEDVIIPKLEDEVGSDNACMSIEASHEEDHTVYNNQAPFLGNKIILGSKPNRDNSRSNICNNAVSVYKKPKVSLKNIKVYLDSCKRYCEICFILFSTEEAYKIHEKSYHLYSITSKKVQPNNVSLHNCNICNITFTNLSNLNRHKKNIHLTKKNQNISEKKVAPMTTASCYHCNVVFSNKESLIEHFYDTLGSKKTEELRNKDALHNKNVFKDVEHSISENNETVQKQDTVDNENVGKVISENNSTESATFVYRCRVCSYSFMNVKILKTHMLRKHHIDDPPTPKKNLYDPKCKFCSYEFPTVSSLNEHIRKDHKKFLVSKISKDLKKSISSPKHDKKSGKDTCVGTNFIDQIDEEDTPAIGDTKEKQVECIFKSALFKCNRCDIHFLNCQLAIDHVGHMEILINWKCSICKHIFKKNDENDHMVQHSVTNDFTVYDISESTPSLILYNCPKCNVHFDKNKYLQHFPVCKRDSVVHVKCKFCGILIDRNLECLHSSHHRRGNVKQTNFITVKTDIIQKNNMNQDSCNNHKDLSMENRELRTRKIIDNISTEDDQFFKVYYCQTCKCFVNAHSIIKHESGKCKDNDESIVCILCGLIYPRKNTSSHARQHTRKLDLKLQDFGFYDLQSKRLINTPIPEFPQCSVCEINFPRKNDKIRHRCGDEEYTICEICNLKFSNLGYKLHMNYHDLTFSHCKSLTETPENSNALMTKAETNNNITIYRCKHCHMSLSNYDLVIEHCQEHLISDEMKTPEGLCKICNIVCDAKFMKSHEEIHLKTFDKNKLEIITFDTCGFKSDYKAWIKKIFNSLPQEKMENIIEKSIYKDQNFIKMKVIQEGTCDITLYKCDICNCFVDPQALIEHLATNCRTLRKHTCKVCSIPFVSQAFKTKHEEVHVRPFKGLQSYRIILFNSKEETLKNTKYNKENRFTLYKCANCNGVVKKNEQTDHVCNKKDLKQCMHCNFLIYSKDLNLHLYKHKKHDTFISKNIKVIVFDKGYENENDEESSTKRKKYDCVIYKCKQCQTCVKDHRSSRKHVCNSSMLKSKCSICGLYFLKNKLKTHYALHTSDRNFVIDNITVVDFDNTKTTGCNLAAVPMKKNIIENNEVTSQLDTNPVKKKIVTTKLYRCSCGLHFLDLSSSWTHQNVSCNSKYTKINFRQQCSKCGLAFDPNVLFKHLVKHHGNKDIIYKFDIFDAINKRKKSRK